MLDRRFAAETLGLFGAALLCAVVANLSRSPEHRLDWATRMPLGRTVSGGDRELVTATEMARRRPAGSPPAAAETTATPSPEVPWHEVSGAESLRLHDRGVSFYDARRSEEFRAGHIAGARSLPVWEAGVEEGLEELTAGLMLGRLEADAPRVVYCSGGDCEDSQLLARRLYAVGCDNILLYRGGFRDWVARGGAIEEGEG